MKEQKGTLKLFKYSGSKGKYMPILNHYFNQVKDCVEVVVEPFCGSAQFSLNIDFDGEIICNDENKYVIDIFESFKLIEDYNHYLEIVNSYFIQYNNVSNKESYYSFRDYVNERILNDVNRPEKAICLIILIGCCINSSPRFNFKSKIFNQGYGDRNYLLLNEKDFNLSLKRINKITFLNEDGINLMKKHDNSKTLIFADPPYFLNTPTYYEFSENQHNELIDIMNNYDSLIMYTDTEHDYLDGWNIEYLDKMKSTRPGKHDTESGIEKKSKIECLYMNF